MLEMINRILNISGKYKKRIILGVIFNILKSLCVSFMFLAIYIVLKDIDRLTSAVIMRSFYAVLGSIIGRFFFQWLSDVYMSTAGYDIFRDQRLSIGTKLKEAPMGFFTDNQLGTIQMILTTTTSELETYSMRAIADLTGGFSMALIMVIILMVFCWPIGVLTLIGLLAGMFMLHLLQNKAAQNVTKMQKVREGMTNKVMEFIRGIAVFRTFNEKEEGLLSIHESFEKKRKRDYKQEKEISTMLKLYTLVFQITSCILLYFSGYLYLEGKISMTYCFMFLITAFLIYSELEHMGAGAFISKQINTGLDRLEALNSIPSLNANKGELDIDNYNIEVRNISFGYGGKRKVINDVSFSIPQGTTCAIIGPSGSGKSTICNLIARFWDVDEGGILIGGKKIADYTADSLLDYISMVFQNVYLFNDTIENNIKFGKPDAALDEIKEVAKRARCYDFIMNLPEGFQTMVGEGGFTLSGGEKQKISIARAMLKDAPIIILDEATSSVDPENEHELLKALEELTKGKTLISIAHRLTTVTKADQIIVVEDGRIVQKGNHKELIKKEGTYKKFLNIREKSAHWKLEKN